MSDTSKKPSLSAHPAEVTAVLLRWSGGDRAALDELLPLVYQELRTIARRHLRRERGDHTLEPTALAHEAFLRLVDQTRVSWNDRAHFFAIAAQAMRRVLVDHARRAHAKRRPDPRARVSFSRLDQLGVDPEVGLLDLDRALERLAELDPRGAQVVELRFFGGLAAEEIAAVLEISTATVHRELRAARTWLHRELTRIPAEPADD